MTNTDAARPTDRSAAIARLTIEQKAAVLTGASFWETAPLEGVGLRPLLLADGPYGIRLQRGRHDNLAMFESDPATCFPPGVAIGSSWNPALAAQLGSALGREAAAMGVDVVLGPGVNIKRSPLCGRNFEYYSEDPLLAGVLGAAYSRAVQAEGPGVSVKHFAANNQETNRQTISADVDERTLREIYLPAFERVVRESAPATVMTSYNKLNGVSTWANRWLLTDVLRTEWGFTGATVSDWSSVTDRVAALRAGLDLEMPGEPDSVHAIVEAVRSGTLEESLVNEAVERIAALDRRSEPRGSDLVIDRDAQHDLARKIAAECIVLLRNEHDILPVPDGVQVAVIGAFAVQPRFQGGGSAHVNATAVDVPLEEIGAAVAATGGSVTFAQGFELDGSDATALRDEAVRVASWADIAIVFAGLSEERESEGFDRSDLDLPADQVSLIKAVASAARRTAVVLSNGGIVSLEGWHDDVDAIVEGFVLGQGGGRAIADVLFGRVDPSGRLAETIPLRVEDHPSWLNFPGEQGHVRYGEGVLVGYRYFTTAHAPIRYPFGHGLSYTTFRSDLADVAATGVDSAQVRVRITNTGTRAGKHVVQLYVATTAGPVRRPLRELRAFDKVELEPGASTDVTLELPRRAFAYWDVGADSWIVAPGEYRIEVCADSMTVLDSAVIQLEGDELGGELTLDAPVAEWFDHPTVGTSTFDALGFTGVAIPAEQLIAVRSMTMRQFIKISGLDISLAALDQIMAATR